ncbi:hypothetical protein GDO81_030130 [Engystomops pustulosus]|uniref:Uncharacterized protein n=1 Tax=Engystomops pustulosus TaxID=76066 RepID=A0AAV6YHV0_ENGPU|nr:hypothetical protein GDO81_030130 [Engystomops pustulosus]
MARVPEVALRALSVDTHAITGECARQESRPLAVPGSQGKATMIIRTSFPSFYCIVVLIQFKLMTHQEVTSYYLNCRIAIGGGFWL